MFHRYTRALLFYLAGLIGFGPMATDLYLASLPKIAAAMQTNGLMVQLTLSLFFAGFSLGQLIWGPLSDRCGRRPVLFLAIALFVFASLACAGSRSIAELIIFRVFQAFGACAGVVMAMAIVKDLFPEADSMVQVLSSMLGVTILLPMIAPLLGGYLLLWLGWRANFYFLAIYGVFMIILTCFLRETYPREKRQPLAVRQLLAIQRRQLRSLPFIFAGVAVAANFSVLFSFLVSSPVIYIQIYHLSVTQFGGMFALNVLGLGSGMLALPYLRKRFAPRAVVRSATAVSYAGAVVMAACLLFLPHNYWSIALPCFVTMLGVGSLYPQLTTFALQQVAAYTGVASSLLSTLRFLVAALTSLFMGVLIKSSAIALPVVMLLLISIHAICMRRYFATCASA